MLIFVLLIIIMDVASGRHTLCLWDMKYHSVGELNEVMTGERGMD